MCFKLSQMKSADPKDLDGFYPTNVIKNLKSFWRALTKHLKSLVVSKGTDSDLLTHGVCLFPHGLYFFFLHAHAWPFFHTLSTYWCVHLKWEYSTRHECSLQCSSAFLLVFIKQAISNYNNKYNKHFNTSQCVTVQYSIQKPNTTYIQILECGQSALLTESKRKHGIANLS